MSGAIVFREHQRIVFVTGKGGVGKSTIAAALARAEADQSGSAVLVELEGAEAAERTLAGEDRGVQQVEVDFLDAHVRAIASMVSSKLLASLVVKQRSMRRLLEAVPAVRELVSLERVRSIAAEHRPTRIFVDLPATGHAVDWLRVPAAAERFLRVGPAARMCRAILDEVVAPQHSALVVVSTAEPVVASETRELCQRLRDDLGRKPALVVLNRTPWRPTAEQRAAAHAAAEREPVWGPLANYVEQDLARSADTEQAVQVLQDITDASLVEIPELFADPRASTVAAQLRRYL